jgi:hypothetical protein
MSAEVAHPCDPLIVNLVSKFRDTTQFHRYKIRHSCFTYAVIGRRDMAG